MKKAIIIFSGLFVIGLSLIGFSYKKNDDVIEYNTGKRDFQIIVLTEKYTEKKAKDIAIKRAAQIAKNNGYEYFTIAKEQKIFIQRGKTNWPSAYDFPQNLYQEEIIERGFDRERFYQRDQNGDMRVKEGIRFFIQSSDKKRRKSYKVCNIIKC